MFKKGRVTRSNLFKIFNYHYSQIKVLSTVFTKTMTKSIIMAQYFKTKKNLGNSYLFSWCFLVPHSNHFWFMWATSMTFLPDMSKREQDFNSLLKQHKKQFHGYYELCTSSKLKWIYIVYGYPIYNFILIHFNSTVFCITRGWCKWKSELKNGWETLSWPCSCVCCLKTGNINLTCINLHFIIFIFYSFLKSPQSPVCLFSFLKYLLTNKM